MGNTSQKKQASPGRLQGSLGVGKLLIWAIILGITLISILLPTSTANAVSLGQSGHTHSLSPRSPRGNCDYQLVCDTANQYTSGDGSPTGGWIKAPVGANGNTLVFFTDPTLTVSQPAVQGLWYVGVLIVDVFIVLLFIMSGIRVMMSGSVFRYADIAETVPRMLLALIAAHISLALMAILLTLNNGLCADLYHYAASQANTVNLDTSLGTDPNINLWNFLNSVWVPLVKLIIFIVRLGLGLMLFAQLIVRVFLIDVYVVLGAPCIACWALPGRSGQPITRMWLQGFISLVMVQAAQTAGIIVAELILGNIITLVNHYLPVPSITGGALTANDFVSAFMSIVVTWFILRIPSLLQASPMQSITAGGQMALGMFGAAVGGASTLAEASSMLVR